MKQPIIDKVKTGPKPRKVIGQGGGTLQCNILLHELEAEINKGKGNEDTLVINYADDFIILDRNTARTV